MTRWSATDLAGTKARIAAKAETARTWNGNTIVCERCGGTAPRTGNMQRYCAPCSTIKDRERKDKWLARNPQTDAQKAAQSRHRDQRNAESRARGMAFNDAERTSLGDPFSRPELKWFVRIAVPFTWAASKNHIYQMGLKGHVTLRAESSTFRDAITHLLKRAMLGQTIVPNKVWLDIFVEKPSHRGDAINVVDLVADAVKVALGIDDRWFCIRGVDWSIVKRNPNIYIAVGQEDVDASGVCSYCGAVRSLSEFTAHAGTPSGRGRICHRCRRKPQDEL